MDLRGPGLILLVPTIDRMVRISLRTVTLTVPPQEVIMRDNIPVRVTAVAYYRVVDPDKAVNQVENFHHATLQIAQTTLRSVLGGVDLDHLLSERERLNEALQHVIDAQTEPWGIKVTTVEIKDVEIPERMQHAIARQAEAERERRAKIINAEGEAQAATRLADAADIIGRNPTTLQLRYLQTLREIGATQNSTVVFPMPIDLIKPVLDAMRPTEATPAAEVSAPHSPENGALNPGESRALGPGLASAGDPSVPASDTTRVRSGAVAPRRRFPRGCGVSGRTARVRRPPPATPPEEAVPRDRCAAEAPAVPREGRAAVAAGLMCLELKRHRGADLLGDGDLESQREALGLVLLDAGLKRLALSEDRPAEADRHVGGGASSA